MNTMAKIYKDILRSNCTAWSPGLYAWAEGRSMGNPLGPRFNGWGRGFVPGIGALCMAATKDVFSEVEAKGM